MKAAAGAALLAACAAVRAAGGHHAVDDAALLDPGLCQVETWAERGPDARAAPHVGPACRVGPVELELDADRVRRGADGSGLQVKWARSVALRLAIGGVANVRWQGDGFAGSTVVLPVTWQPLSGLWLHANLGRDLQRGAPDRWRNGAAVEWAPAVFGSAGAQPRLSFVAEAFRVDGAGHARGGFRWYATPRFNVDVSRTSHGGWWTLGLTWVFDAPVAPASSSPVAGGR